MDGRHKKIKQALDDKNLHYPSGLSLKAMANPFQL